MRQLRVTAYGDPKPQGSGQLIRAKDGRMFKKTPKTSAVWRNTVTEAIRAAIDADDQWPGPMTGALDLEVSFYFQRPKSHPKWRKNIPAHINQPDLDKLVRAVGDALTVAGAIKDDSHVYELSATKIYSNVAGMDLWIREIHTMERP